MKYQLFLCKSSWLDKCNCKKNEMDSEYIVMVIIKPLQINKI